MGGRWGFIQKHGNGKAKAGDGVRAGVRAAVNPGRVGGLWGGVYPCVGGQEGALLGQDVVVREGSTKYWDKSARRKRLCAVYAEACCRG